VLTRASAGNVHGFKNIRINYMMGVLCQDLHIRNKFIANCEPR
jgi:hypothetical protein